MIPDFTASGVLPPYIGESPANPTAFTPYSTSILEVAKKLVHSHERVALLQGLIRQRQALAGIGVTMGFQWIDGSFCEDVETIRERPPSDIDVVTLLVRPAAATSSPAWKEFVQQNAHVFERHQAKKNFHCDAFYVDVGLPAFKVLEQVTYYFSLFTHQRETFQWKGMLRVPLASDDDQAVKYLDELELPE